MVTGLDGPAIGTPLPPLNNLVLKVEVRKSVRELSNRFPRSISWRGAFPMNKDLRDSTVVRLQYGQWNSKGWFGS